MCGGRGVRQTLLKCSVTFCQFSYFSFCIFFAFCIFFFGTLVRRLEIYFVFVFV